MADYSIWFLEAQNITVSGGQSLSGMSQGDGSQLSGQTVTLETSDWIEMTVRADDENFDDNPDEQVLRGGQILNGVEYDDGTRVEAEYTVVLRDPTTMIEYLGIAVNVNNSNPAYATVEGLAFIGDPGAFPPAGVAFQVVSTEEGPGDFGEGSRNFAEYVAPICFTPGTQIATPNGPRAVESLVQGDLVLTRDKGACAVQWIGRSEHSAVDVQARPSFRPVRIKAGALGGDMPAMDLVVSQQHRVLVTGWKAELLFGEPEVLVAARHLIGRPGIVLDEADGGVTYVHLMLETHEVVTANGAAAETFFPGPAAMGTLSDETRADLQRHLSVKGPSLARDALRAWEAAALVG